MGKRLLVLLMCVALLTSCAGLAKIDINAYPIDPGGPDKIPDVCKTTYDSAIPRVAVVNFTNNTTFDYAKTVQENVQAAGSRSRVGAAGMAVGPGVAGAVWGEAERSQFQAESQKVEREMSAKLTESVEDGVVDVIVNIGGSRIFTRSEMKKILEEQKFQMSGLVDDRTLVQFGKLAGVKYIITGSVNNVNLTYKSFSEAKEGAKQYLGPLGAVGAAYYEAKEGWNVETEVAIRILDVETGEILLSKKVSGKEVLGKGSYPSFDALIGGIKKAASIGLEGTRLELSKYFTVKGYILQTRTSSDGKIKVALVNIGEKLGLKQGLKLYVYTFQEISDPFTGKSSCDMQKLPFELMVTNQLQPDKAWVAVKDDAAVLQRLKVGQLVERAPF